MKEVADVEVLWNLETTTGSTKDEHFVFNSILNSQKSVETRMILASHFCHDMGYANVLNSLKRFLELHKDSAVALDCGRGGDSEVLTTMLVECLKKLADSDMDKLEKDVANLLDTCLGIIAVQVKEADGDSILPPTCEICLRLMNSLCRLQHVPEAVRHVLQANSRMVVERALDIAKTCSVKCRQIVVSSLVSPVLQQQQQQQQQQPDTHPSNDDDCLETSLWGVIQTIDPATSSMLLCLLVDRSGGGEGEGEGERDDFVRKITTTADATTFWLLLQNLFMSRDSLCRKRAVFILKKVTEFWRKHGNPGTTDHTGSSLSGDRTWIEDYLDTFSHLEGVNSTHLFEQVEVLVKHLFQVTKDAHQQQRQQQQQQQQEEEVMMSGHPLFPHATIVISDGFPLPSFKWMQALVSMLLGLSLPTIRKMTLYSLLGGAWPLNYADPEVINWFRRDLVISVDSVQYFPSAASASSAPSLDDTHHRQYPGVLFPQAVARFMEDVRGSPEVANRFIDGLLKTICEEGSSLKGVLVATWVLAAFADPRTLALVPENALSKAVLGLVTAYVRVHLTATNHTLRAYLYSGLLPLVLKGCGLACSDSGPETLLELLDTVGLAIVTGSDELMPLLTNTLRMCDGDRLCSLRSEGKLRLRTALLVPPNLMGGMKKPSNLYSREMDSLGRINDTDKSSWENEMSQEEQRGALEMAIAIVEWVHLERSYQRKGALVQAEDVWQLGSLTSLARYIARTAIAAIDTLRVTSESASAVFVPYVTQSALDQALSALGHLPMVWEGEETQHPSRTETYMEIMRELVSSLQQRTTSTTRGDELMRAVATSALASLTTAMSCSWAVVTSEARGRGLPRGFFTIDKGAMIGMLHTGTELPSSEHHRNTIDGVKKQWEETCEGARASAFVADVSTVMSSYGKYASRITKDKWQALAMALQVQRAEELASGSSPTQVGESRTPCSFAALKDEVSSLSADAVPHFLDALPSLLEAVLISSPSTRDADVGAFQGILEAAWVSISQGLSYVDWGSLVAFVSCLFAPSIAPHFDAAFVKERYEDIIVLGSSGRPSLVQLVAFRMCVLIKAHPALLAMYDDQVLNLIFLREPTATERHTSNAVAALEGGMLHTATRFVAMTMLEEIHQGETGDTTREAMRGLVLKLVAMNKSKEFRNPAMIGSDAYVRKLRCWQALCVLSKVVDEELYNEIADTYFDAISQKCLGTIRTHMEIFGALMTRRFPAQMLPQVLLALKDFNQPQHVLCSCFIVLGFILFDSEGAAGAGALTQANLSQMIVVILPWLGVSSGLSRAIALLLLLDLIPRVTSVNNNDNNSDSSAQIQTEFLASIYHMLTSNKESQKVIKRQQHFFHEYGLADKDCMAGLLRMPQDTMGEIVPDNLYNVVQVVFRASVLESQEQDLRLASLEREVAEATNANNNDSSGKGASITLQTKVVPFDELKLAIRVEAGARALNGAMKRKQNLVVCAALVDKVQNLAGIARTSEIFSVESMVLSDLSVVNSDVFKGIAVSADNWLQMDEVKPIDLLPWIRGMRTKGYTIVALEQTDNSVMMGQCGDLPEKCVLLVGKEREGIPVEYLQEVSVCLEIPQFGVIRSLNVHVSTALAIWEITKSNVARQALD